MVVDQTLIGVPRESVGDTENVPENWNQDAALDPFGGAWGGQERIHVHSGSHIQDVSVEV